MTIASAANEWQYDGNGVTTQFATGKIFDDDELIVYLIEDATLNADLQVKTTEYTVSGMLTDDVIVTFVTPPPSGYTVLIYRSIPQTQTTDFKNQGGFLPESHEDRIDRMTMMIQDLQAQLNRCLKIDRFNISGDDPSVPVFQDTFFIRANGQQLEFVAISDSVIPNSSETEAGLIEIATVVEAQTGTDQNRAMTPYLLQQVTATETRAGVVELATNAEVTTGADTARAVTPAGLHQKVATDTAIGLVELATNIELQIGTDTTRAVTCANVEALKASQSSMETGTSTTFIVTPGRQVHHPSAAKLWGKFDTAAGLLASFNITSLTDTGTGEVAVTIATDYSGADYALVASIEKTTTSLTVANARHVGITTATLAAGTFSLTCWDQTATTNLVKDPASWHCVGFGDR